MQVLVDEFQDTSAVQFELIHMLTSQHRSLFVVGDPNQVCFLRDNNYSIPLFFYFKSPSQTQYKL